MRASRSASGVSRETSSTTFARASVRGSRSRAWCARTPTLEIVRVSEHGGDPASRAGQAAWRRFRRGGPPALALHRAAGSRRSAKGSTTPSWRFSRGAGCEIVYQEKPRAGLRRRDLRSRSQHCLRWRRDPAQHRARRCAGTSPRRWGRSYESLGIPVFGRLTEEARARGWRPVVGRSRRRLPWARVSERTPEGLGRLEDLLRPSGIDLVPVPLPHFKGREVCLHLMSIISIVDGDLAVVFAPLLAGSLPRGDRGSRLPAGRGPGRGIRFDGTQRSGARPHGTA